MDILKARKIIRSLAEGVDPSTGEILSGENIYNSPDVIRALYTVLEATAPKSVHPLDPYRNAGKPWTELEDDKLIDEFHANVKLAEIAKEHGRTYKAIECRLEHLGLKKKPFWQFKYR